jgi:hypothetical protein
VCKREKIGKGLCLKFAVGHSRGTTFQDAIAFDDAILDVPGSFNYWQPRNHRQKLGFEKAIALLESINYGS